MPGEYLQPLEVREEQVIAIVNYIIFGDRLAFPEVLNLLRSHNQPPALLEAVRVSWQARTVSNKDKESAEEQIGRWQSLGAHLQDVRLRRDPLSYDPSSDITHPGYNIRAGAITTGEDIRSEEIREVFSEEERRSV